MKNTQITGTIDNSRIIDLAIEEIFGSYCKKGCEVSDGVLAVIEDLKRNPVDFRDVPHCVAHIRKYGTWKQMDIARRSYKETFVSDMSDNEGKALNSVDDIPEVGGIMTEASAKRMQAERILNRIKLDIMKDKKLKKSAKALFFLHYFRGIPQKKLAERFGITERTVRNRLKSLKLQRFADKYPDFRESLAALGGQNTAFGCDMRDFLTVQGNSQPAVSSNISPHWIPVRKGDKTEYVKDYLDISFKNGVQKYGRHDNVIECKDGRKIELVPSNLRKYNKGLSLKPREYYITERGRDLMTHEKPKQNTAQAPDFTREKAWNCMLEKKDEIMDEIMEEKTPVKVESLPDNPFAPWSRRGGRREKWGL